MSTPCRGACKGTDRPMMDSPAKMVRLGAKRVLVCSCCGDGLQQVTEMDEVLGKLAREVAASPNRRFECRRCEYDVVLITEIVAKEAR